jgi:hypothetical protein
LLSLAAIHADYPQFDNCHIRVVTLPMTEPNDPGVTAVPIFVSEAQLIKETLDRFNAGRSLNGLLYFAFLSAKATLSDLECTVPGVESNGPPGGEDELHGSWHSPFRALGLACERDRLSTNGLSSFTFSTVVTMCSLSVDKEGRQVSETADPVFRRSSQFTMCF